MKQYNSWFIFISVIKALFFREIKTRFGSHPMGYIWAIVEPLSHVLVLSFIFSFVGRNDVNQIPFPYFVGISIISWLLFANTFNKVSNGINANIGLFFYKQVKIFDVMVSRAIIEAMLFFFLVACLEIFLWLMDIDTYMNNFLGVLLTSVEIVFFGFAMGLLFSVIFTLFENIKKIVMIFMRLLYFSSTIFYPLSIIPNKYQEFFLLNPIVNMLENIRHYYFGSFDKIEGSHFYIFWWIVIPLFLGLALIKTYEQKLLSS